MVSCIIQYPTPNGWHIGICENPLNRTQLRILREATIGASERIMVLKDIESDERVEVTFREAAICMLCPKYSSLPPLAKKILACQRVRVKPLYLQYMRARSPTRHFRFFSLIPPEEM